ncbi:NTP transferase domain-containing protein [Rubrivirga sp. IMCC43871]|uniref:NTP transferase domain-containing protein n=1 Tax=Rubrivirga sp. IMCC43871 TaxID=3391575 RepID=UPI00399034A4
MTVPLLLLAAGRSTRFGALKQVAPVGPGGASILTYTVVDALLAGFEEVVVVVRPEIEATIREHLDRHLGAGLPIRIVHQRAALGTAHAALVGLDGIDGPSAIANGDDAYGRDALTRLWQSASTTSSAVGEPVWCALVAYPILDTLSDHGGVSRGWVQTEGDAVTAIDEIYDVREEGGHGPLRGRSVSGEDVALPRDALGSMNLWVLGPGIQALLAREFDRQTASGEFLLSSVLDRLRAGGEVTVRLAGRAHGWFGLTFAADLPAATARIAEAHRAGHYTQPLAAQVDPFRADTVGSPGSR